MPCAIRRLVITLELASGSVAGVRWRRQRSSPRIGGGRRAMETVLCNNNWMAVSFHLGMTPFAFCDCGRTKKRIPCKGWRRGTDNQCAATTTEMILVRQRVAAVTRFYKESSRSFTHRPLSFFPLIRKGRWRYLVYKDTSCIIRSEKRRKFIILLFCIFSKSLVFL